jgi:hypothetical protein
MTPFYAAVAHRRRSRDIEDVSSRPVRRIVLLG